MRAFSTSSPAACACSSASAASSSASGRAAAPASHGGGAAPPSDAEILLTKQDPSARAAHAPDEHTVIAHSGHICKADRCSKVRTVPFADRLWK